MLVEKDRKVAVSYVLTVEGEEVDRAESTNPLEFIFGHGFLLPRFEEEVAGLAEGSEFSFELSPEEGYGVYVEQNVVGVPLDIFEIDGELQWDLLRVGNAIPMQMRGGGTMVGRVREVGEEVVTMDFNHELAGKSLRFSGRIEHVAMATEDELAELSHHHCCGGGGECGGGGDCGCGGGHGSCGGGGCGC